MKIAGTIRSTEARKIEAEGRSYDEAKAALKAQIPKGWPLQQIRELERD